MSNSSYTSEDDNPELSVGPGTIFYDRFVPDATKRRDDLLDAARALVARWDTPSWKDAEHTGVFINKLRAAIAAIESQPKEAA